MARYRATIQGRRGEASRLGDSKSGVHAAANAWDIGVEAHGYVQDDTDVIAVSFTKGSNDTRAKGVIYYRLADGQPSLLLSVGVANLIEFSDDFIDRLLQNPVQAAKLRGKLFCSGKAVDYATT